MFTATLSSAQDVPVVFDYTTVDNSAVAGIDYASVSSTVVFAPGETTKTITVQVFGNTAYQNSRAFNVKLSNVINKTAVIFGGGGQGMIVDDDPVPVISVSSVSVVEGNSGMTPATVTVTLSGETALPAVVNYKATNGTATLLGADYIAAADTLTFAPGETEKTVTVQVVGDTLAEETETFAVSLSGSKAANLLINKGVVTVIDDDSTSWVNKSIADFNAGTVDAGAFV